MKTGHTHYRRKAAAAVWAVLILTVFALMPAKTQAAGTAETTVYRFLTEELKLNPAAACGVMANIQGEAGFTAHIYGLGGAYGICQWTGTRQSRLFSVCAERGLSASSLEGQLAFVKEELNSTFSSVLSYLRTVANTADGAYNAGYYWCRYFGIPGEGSSLPAIRGDLARSTFWPVYGASSVYCSASSQTGKVVLTWTGNGAGGFRVSRSLSSGGPFTDLGKTGRTVKTWTDTTGVRGKRYYYRVSALTSAGKAGTVSNVCSGICLPSLNDARCKVETLKTSMTYTGKPLKCPVRVTYGSTVLTEGKHYNVVYGLNTNVGKAYIKVTGKGSFSGKVYKTFAITRGTQKITASDMAVYYTTSALKLKASAPGKITAVSSDTGVAEVKGTSILIKRSGYCYITVKAAQTANLKAASKKICLRVYPARPTKPVVTALKGRRATVTWKAASCPGGYWVRYSTSPTFRTYETKVIGASAGTRALLTGLKGTTVYVKVCCFKRADGKYLFGKWSDTVKVTVKK